MPTIPFAPLPDVASTGAPGVFQRADAEPGMFGGFSAQGMQRVGQALEQGADAASQNAIRFQSLKNETMAKDADRQLMNTLDGLAYNPQSGYFTKLGRDAVEGYDGAAQQANEAFQAARDALPNDEAKRMFDNSAMRNLSYTLGAMSRHAAQQNKLWQVDAADGRIATYQQTAANYANDGQRFKQALATIRSEVVSKGELLGWSPEQVSAEATAQESKARVGRIQRMLVTDPMAAETLYREDAPYIEPAARPVLERELRAGIYPVEAKRIADGIVKAGGSAIDVRANLVGWQREAEEQADKTHPNDPVFRDLVVQQVKGYVNTISIAQEAVQRQAGQRLMAAAMGSGGQKPLTVDELLASPDARQAWTIADPQAQRGILALLDHNAREAQGIPVRTDPHLFEGLFQRVHLPDGDPNKISRPEQIAPYFANGLSRTDYDWLKREIDQNQTPDGQRLSTTRESFLSGMKPQFDKSTIMSVDPKGAEQFYKFKTFVLDAERKAREAGKDPFALYNPNSPEYLGKSIGQFQRSLEEQLRDRAEALKAGSAAKSAAPVKISSQADFDKLPKGAHFINPADGRELVK